MQQVNLLADMVGWIVYQNAALFEQALLKNVDDSDDGFYGDDDFNSADDTDTNGGGSSDDDFLDTPAGMAVIIVIVIIVIACLFATLMAYWLGWGPFSSLKQPLLADNNRRASETELPSGYGV